MSKRITQSRLEPNPDLFPGFHLRYMLYCNDSIIRELDPDCHTDRRIIEQYSKMYPRYRKPAPREETYTE